jgi:hypothetical protein
VLHLADDANCILVAAIMKIPFTSYVIKGHAPGKPADFSQVRTERGKKLLGEFANGIFDGLPVKVQSTRKAATAERLRGKFTYLARNAAKMSAKNAALPALRAQATIEDTSQASRNEACAHEALRNVRLALYSTETGSSKSTNKFYPAQRESEIRRVEQGPHPDRHGAAASAVNSRHYSALVSTSIWQSKRINCDDLAFAVTDVLAYAHPEVPVSYALLPDSHAFAIVGAIPEDCAHRPLAAWPSHIYICDPWANIVCPAPEFPSKFGAKMQKWQAGGKVIRNSKGEWIPPTDPAWVACTEKIPTICTRHQYADGQFDNCIAVTRRTESAEPLENTD